MGQHGPRPNWKTSFIKICLLWIFFYFVFFLPKRGHFQLKQLANDTSSQTESTKSIQIIFCNDLYPCHTFFWQKLKILNWQWPFASIIGPFYPTQKSPRTWLRSPLHMKNFQIITHALLTRNVANRQNDG